MTGPPVFIHSLCVRYFECDMQGHVFNAHYFTWMDIAHTELWREAVGPYQDFTATGFEFVVAEASARFRHSAHFDDRIEIAVEIDELTTTSVSSRHTLRRADTILVEGSLRHVCVRGDTYAKAPWPDAVRRALAPYVRDHNGRASREG